MKDVGGGYLFFQIIQIIFDIEENTTIRLFRLNLSIFKHNLPFIALSNGPPFMLQSTSKFVYVFIKWHVCIVIISLFLHTTSPASSTRLVIGTSRTVGSAKKFVRITSGFGGGEFTKTLRKVCTCQKLK